MSEDINIKKETVAPSGPERRSVGEFLIRYLGVPGAIVASLGIIFLIVNPYNEISELKKRVCEYETSTSRLTADNQKTVNELNSLRQSYRTLVIYLIQNRQISLSEINNFLSEGETAAIKVVSDTMVSIGSANQALTRRAWDFFNRHYYTAAINSADSCISLFHVLAENQQNILIRNNVPIPHFPADRRTRDIIFSRGLINDVATCYYIKGESYKSKNDTTNAIAAFSGAMSFPHAFCWDPGGFFWSINEAAEGRIQQLKR